SSARSTDDDADGARRGGAVTDESRATLRLVRYGALVNVVLALVKLLAGVLGNSYALIADGVESTADVLGSLVVWGGVRIASRGADEAYPFGYGKAEALAASVVGLMLLAAAIGIGIESAREIVTPHHAPAPFTLVVLVLVVLVKEVLFRRVAAHGAKTGSTAASADAWHHRSDAITSAAAFIGVSVAIWGPGLFNAPNLVLADEAAAILASGIILFTAFRLIRPSLRELLDATTPALAEKVRSSAAKVEGVALVEKVHARKSGRGYLVDMHLHVAPDLSVRAAHALAGKVKAVVRENHPAVRHVLIHIEPDERPDPPTGLTPPQTPGR
ncbi:MAG: cation diffusion facilitator family transporter, partial [Planctomycetota bacterium]|nr:cation diffusion facilitator family transporter [Planctomycetota bacterium]